MSSRAWTQVPGGSESLMRVKTGHGTPGEWANARLTIIWPNSDDPLAIFVVIRVTEDEARLVVPVAVMFDGH
jgi:hypothetical protein